MVVGPLRDQALDLSLLRREGDTRVGPERRVLGEGHRIVGPGAVHHGARDDDDPADPRAGGRLEDSPRPLDVGPFGERGIRSRCDEEREVGNGVRPLEHGFEVGGREVELVELE